jgi:hypothetical protein
MNLLNKISSAVLDYEYDFVNQLAAGESIVSVSGVTISGGITVSNVTKTGSEVSFRLSGGTVGEHAVAHIMATTNTGEVLVEPAEVFIPV